MYKMGNVQNFYCQHKKYARFDSLMPKYDTHRWHYFNKASVINTSQCIELYLNQITRLKAIIQQYYFAQKYIL